MADENETTTTKKAAPQKKTAPQKKAAPRKKAASGTQKRTSSGSSTRKTAQRSRPSAVVIAREAREQLSELLNKDTETVIGIQRTDDGWEVDLEIVETERIPDTTDVLAIYRVQVDESGGIEGYQRLERYIRGQAEGGVVRD